MFNTELPDGSDGSLLTNIPWVFTYNSKNDTWDVVSVMKTPRSGHGITLIESNFFKRFVYDCTNYK